MIQNKKIRNLKKMRSLRRYDQEKGASQRNNKGKGKELKRKLYRLK